MKIQVAIVEDDKNYNNTLKKVINYNDQMCCVGQYFSGKAASDHLEELAPDVVLMDLQLYDSSSQKPTSQNSIHHLYQSRRRRQSI